MTKKRHPIDAFIGKRILAARKYLGWSQSELARRLPGKIAYQQLQRWEHGVSAVSAKRLYEIARALKVDISYFFRRRKS